MVARLLKCCCFFTFANLAALGGGALVLLQNVTVARAGTNLLFALDVAILFHNRINKRKKNIRVVFFFSISSRVFLSTHKDTLENKKTGDPVHHKWAAAAVVVGNFI